MDRSGTRQPYDRRFAAGTPRKFLVSGVDASILEMRLALGEELRRRRIEKALTQDELAELCKTSQSRIAKMESGDGTVSIDLLFRALLKFGARRAEIGRCIAFAPSLRQRSRSKGAWTGV